MKAIMGIEIHIHLLTKTKLFCSCSTDYESKEPNTLVCPICLGFPGSKPKVNKKAVDFGIMVAKALNCKINPEIFFSRKSYFYPDMPKNFQISQYEIPLAIDGYLEISNKKIRIRRIHLEEDPAKLIHAGGDITSATHVLADYNRAGIPLLEIVTEPDFESTQEVREFLSKLSSILEHLEVFDPSKEGSLRVDANISLKGGERVEIKNISGFANVQKALDYEIIRQKNLKKLKKEVERETRHFDSTTRTTHTLRKKEVEEDYGYIFEPDLTKIEIPQTWIKSLKMPELPEKRIERFVKEFKIPKQQASIIVYTDKALADFFEACVKIYKNYKKLARWIVTDLLKCLNWNKLRIKESKVKPKTFVELLNLMDKGEITETLGKEIIKEYVPSGKSPKQIVEERGLGIIKDKKELQNIISKVVKENKKAVEDLKAGKKEALEFLIGQVLRKTGKKADPKVVRGLIKKLVS
jgi:aspartyl-tRNA(Asn)/glutamyl-tRNA(Gln) amidotransferase subunit B